MIGDRSLISVLIISISLLLFAVHPLSASHPGQPEDQLALKIEPGTAEGNSGGQVTLEVIAQNAAAVAGLQLELAYDGAVVQAIAVEPGTLPEGTLFQGNPNSGTSPVSVVIASAESFGSDHDLVTLAKITFNLVGDSGSMTDLVLDQVVVSNEKIQPLPFTTSNAKITIAGEIGGHLSIELHQDPVDGAAGLQLDIIGPGEPAPGPDPKLLLGSFQVRVTYDGSCLNIQDVRELDFTVSDVSIDNITGVTTFNGSSTSGEAAPAALGHVLTRLVDGAPQPCPTTLEIADLMDVDRGATEVDPASLTLELLRGDALADGDIDIADGRYIGQYLVGSRTECTAAVDRTCLHTVNAASVRNAGAIDRITVADALFIAQYLAGLRDEF